MTNINEALKIKEVVENYYSCSLDKSNAKDRHTDYRKPRQIAMYFIKEYTKLHLAQIGSIFDKDHATVLHSVKTVKTEIKNNAEYKKETDAIRRDVEFIVAGFIVAYDDVFQQNDFFPEVKRGKTEPIKREIYTPYRHAFMNHPVHSGYYVGYNK